MTRKENFLARVALYQEKATNTNIFVKPTKTIDSGLIGKLYEMKVKEFLGCVNGRNVSAQGRTDTRKHNKNIEIKSGCSELDILFNDKKKIDFVIYCPDFLPQDKVEFVSYVLTKNDFIKALQENNLIRLKKSSAGIVKRTIQSYKNSNKKYNSFLDSLDTYGKPLTSLL